jgi:hypothetical protein
MRKFLTMPWNHQNTLLILWDCPFKTSAWWVTSRRRKILSSSLNMRISYNVNYATETGLKYVNPVLKFKIYNTN